MGTFLASFFTDIISTDCPGKMAEKMAAVAEEELSWDTSWAASLEAVDVSATDLTLNTRVDLMEIVDASSARRPADWQRAELKQSTRSAG